MRNNIVLWLKKFGTILADRRFAAAVASLVLLFLSVPEDQTGEIIKALGVLVEAILLVISWTVREPSGLGYEAKAIARLVNKNYSK